MVSGRFAAFWAPMNIRATRRSFHTNRNWKIASAAMTGMLIGMASRKNIDAWPAPSISADSKTSLGRPRM